MPIRNIQAGDIPACAALIRASFQTVADEFGFTRENAPRFTAFAVDEGRLRVQLEEQRPMFAYFDENKEMAGYYSLLVKEEGVCELNNLCVLPGRRHEGIGGRLLAHAFQEGARLGCGRMEIGIVEENAVLKEWYRGFGFTHTGTKKFDFFPFTCGYMERRLG